MIPESVVNQAIQYAYSEIDKFGLPTRLHLDLSIQKGREIAKAMKADESIVVIGVCLMDIKLGEAFKTKRQPEHVKMGVEASKAFLQQFSLDNETTDKIINSIEAHHGTVPFNSPESEIVANADCYRFIHPKGVLHYIGTLTKRELSFPEILDGAEAKLEEKKNILSLPYCKTELEPYYTYFKQMFNAARKA